MVFWDRTNARTQLKFLNGIDPTYFRYLVGVHQPQLDGEDSLRAALALRFAYSHALEILFAFVCAAIQAPRCPAGWLLRHKHADLKKIVAKIEGRRQFDNRLNFETMGWREIATDLLPQGTPGDEWDELREATITLLQGLARDFLDHHREDEYNSLKHGLRVQTGEFYFAIGREDVPGIPAPPERMRRLTSSPFGSTFLRTTSLKKYQCGFEEQRVNWNPETLAMRTLLVAGTIQNIINSLKYINGVPEDESEFSLFDQSSVLSALMRADRSTAFKLTWREHITAEMIPSLSRANVLGRIHGNDNAPRDP